MKTSSAALRPLKECRLLVTPTSFGRSDPALKDMLSAEVGEVVYNPLGRPLEAEEVRQLIGEVDGYIAGLDRIDASVLAAAPRLRVIARYGSGVDRVDLAAATRCGVVVTNTPGANAVAVAELTIGLMLALARNLRAADAATRRGEWPRLSGVGLRGKTVGLIGLGAVGQEVARRLAAFGCRVMAVDPKIGSVAAQACGAQLASLDELLAESDFISLHATATPETYHLVDAAFLQRVKPGAFLINTARGELVNEAALQAALERGHLRGAALDCFRQEPPGRDHPLLRLPQVLVTPHSGSHTDEAMNRMGWMALEDCLAVLRGQRPQFAINSEVFATDLEAG